MSLQGAAFLGELTGSHTRIVEGPRFAQCAYAVRSVSAQSPDVLGGIDPYGHSSLAG